LLKKNKRVRGLERNSEELIQDLNIELDLTYHPPEEEYITCEAYRELLKKKTNPTKRYIRILTKFS